MAFTGFFFTQKKHGDFGATHQPTLATTVPLRHLANLVAVEARKALLSLHTIKLTTELLPENPRRHRRLCGTYYGTAIKKNLRTT